MASNVRSVTVRMNADVAKYIANMRLAGRETDKAFNSAVAALKDTNENLKVTEDQVGSLGKSSGGIDKVTGSVENLSSSSKDLSQNVTQLERTVTKLDQRTERLSGLNSFTGRIRAISDAVAILGPGLVPIGATLGPAIAGISMQLGSAALAGAGAVIAFQGVGDAVKQLQEYDLDPTATNLANAQAALEKLGPDAIRFVAAFREFRPVLDGIKDSAAAGVFPGVIESLESFEKLAPRVEDLFYNVNRAAGEALASSAESLTTDRWREFISYIDTEAPNTIRNLTATVGDLTHGLAEMMIAADPGNDDFQNWLKGVADGFDNWASSSEGRDSIQGFLDYARQNGPAVRDFFVSLVDAVAQIVQAAAPLGGPVLTALTAVLDVIASIADSDLGTPLLAAAAGAAVLNRSLQATSALLSRVAAAQKGSVAAGLFPGFSTRTKEVGGSLSAIQSKAKAAQGSVAGLRKDLSLVSGGRGPLRTLNASLTETGTAATRARAGIGSMAGSLGKATAGVAAFAAISTEAGQGLGVTNTATLGLVGTLAGPWGAAIGTGVGLTLDFASASGEAGEAQARLSDAVRNAGTDMSALNTVTQQGVVDAANYGESLSIVGKVWEGWDKLFTGRSGEDSVLLDAAAARVEAVKLQEAFTVIGTSLGELGKKDVFGSKMKPSLEDLTRVAQMAQPAMDALGVSAEDLSNMDSSGWQFLALRIAAFNRASESSGGKARALADAFGDLDNDLIDTATAADKVAAALSSLLDPTLDAEAATDQWMKSLATLRNELESDVGFDGAGARMLKNKELTRDYVEDAKARLIALAGLSETTEGQMAAAVQKTRTAFIESGIAAGFSRKEIEKRANELNLTPELVKTTFEAAGIDRSILQVREARRNIEALPKKVQTVVRADGIPRTIGEVNALVKKYNLTEKERRALITLRDLASKGIGIVDGKLKRIDGKKADPKVGLNTGKFDANSARVARQNAIMDRAKPTPTANLNTAPFNGKYGGTMGSLNTLNAYKANPTANLIDNASGVAGFIRSQIAAIQSKTVTITAYYRSTGAIKPPGERAGGGLITGPGGPTDDQIPTLLSNREFVQRNAAVEYYGENFMHALNSLRVPREAVRGYADGGMVTRADRASQILRESGSARTRVRAGAPIGRGGGRLRIDLGEVRVSGAIDAATGMAVIEGRARAWARDELESVADHDYEMAGMSEDD